MHLTLVPYRLNNSGQHYAALDEAGEVVVTSRQPFYAAARALQAQGYDDEVVLTASHRGSPGIGMRSTIGAAAVWSATESDKSGLGRSVYEPFDRPDA